jgi:hypothetical protein
VQLVQKLPSDMKFVVTLDFSEHYVSEHYSDSLISPISRNAEKPAPRGDIRKSKETCRTLDERICKPKYLDLRRIFRIGFAHRRVRILQRDRRFFDGCGIRFRRSAEVFIHN